MGVKQRCRDGRGAGVEGAGACSALQYREKHDQNVHAATLCHSLSTEPWRLAGVPGRRPHTCVPHALAPTLTTSHSQVPSCSSLSSATTRRPWPGCRPGGSSPSTVCRGRAKPSTQGHTFGHGASRSARKPCSRKPIILAGGLLALLRQSWHQIGCKLIIGAWAVQQLHSMLLPRKPDCKLPAPFHCWPLHPCW